MAPLTGGRGAIATPAAGDLPLGRHDTPRTARRAWRNHVENENYGIVVDVSDWVAIAIGVLIGIVMAILL